MPTGMDLSLLGTLVLAAAFLPYAAEVFWQVRLQARFVAALPAPVRDALPPHPRRPLLAAFSSARFQLALWRYARHDLPQDPPPVLALKHRVRTSLLRELVWMALMLLVLAVLVAIGWRPVWPWSV